MAKLVLFAAFIASGVNALTLEKPMQKMPKDLIKKEMVLPLLDISPAQDNKAVVQILRSDEGMAYYGSMWVGGQEQIAIYDTGSFDVVIESKCTHLDLKNKKSFVNVRTSSDVNSTGSRMEVPHCCNQEKCPNAKYSSKLSGKNYVEDFAIFNPYEQITYGSGPVVVKSGTDHVSVRDQTLGKTKGNIIAQAKVPIKIIVDHEVDLFKETEMTAIVGMGPGKFEERQKRLVNHLGVKRFMVCFQENQKANGFWTWHDRDRSGDQAWMAVPVPGKQFWAVPTSDFKISNTQVGCQPSCGGIIDTGTSLITPPKAVVDAITAQIESGSIEDCSDLTKFPAFEFKLGDHQLSLPPSSYIADAGAQNIEVFHQQLAFAPLPMNKRDLAMVTAAKEAGQAAPAVHSCVLLLSPGDESEQTQFGPMVIFGMSLFRKYAVQFDLAGDMEGTSDSRVMRFAEAAHDCSGPVRGGEFRRTTTLQKVNLDKLRVSPLQQRVASEQRNGKMGIKMRRKSVLRI